MRGAIRDGGGGGAGSGAPGRGAVGSAARAPLWRPRGGDRARPPGHPAPSGTGRAQRSWTLAARSLRWRRRGARRVGPPGHAVRRGWAHWRTAERTWRWAPCPAALRALRENCFTAPKFVHPRPRGPGWGWHPEAFACREPRAAASEAAAVPRPRDSAAARIPDLVSDAQATTGPIGGNPSGSLGKTGWRSGRGQPSGQGSRPAPPGATAVLCPSPPGGSWGSEGERSSQRAAAPVTPALESHGEPGKSPRLGGSFAVLSKPVVR